MKSNKYIVSLIVASVIGCSTMIAQVDHLVPDPKIPPHPRILMLKGEEAAVKKTIAGDKIWDKLHQSILAECDNMITMPVLERIQIGRRLLDKSREAIRRLFFLSYAYRMTGQKKYLDRAEKEMLDDRRIQRLESFPFPGCGRNDHGHVDRV